jgi:hypothetical protein
MNDERIYRKLARFQITAENRDYPHYEFMDSTAQGTKFAGENLLASEFVDEAD